MNVRLQHVSIPRPPGSEALTRAFYGELLGLPEIAAPNSIEAAEVIWFKLGEDAELHCFREEPLGDASNRHFCLVVDDVPAVRQKLVAAGYSPYDGEAIPGRPRFFCCDPFGNRIEFTTIVGDYLELQ